MATECQRECKGSHSIGKVRLAPEHGRPVGLRGRKVKRRAYPCRAGRAAADAPGGRLDGYRDDR